MARQSIVKLTYDDLQRFPDDGLRRELIDGELIVTPAPITRHQRTVIELVVTLYRYAETHGGQVLTARYDLKFSDHNVVEPDVLFIRDPERLGEKNLETAPDLVIEVSSPGTKRLDRIRKRALYERFAVPEYWIVDLDENAIEAYILEGDHYRDPVRFAAGDEVRCAALPGFSAPFAHLVPG